MRLPLTLHCDLATAPGEHEDSSDEPHHTHLAIVVMACAQSRSMGRPHASEIGVDCYLKRIKP